MPEGVAGANGHRAGGAVGGDDVGWVTEGQAEAVTEALEAYVQAQQQAFQNYLPDQYEVAADARLETAPTGEVVLVMSADAADVQQKIDSALAS